MESYSSSGRSIKQESDRESSDSPSDRRGSGNVDADNLMDMQAQIQQLLASTGQNPTGTLLSPLHFLQASGSAGAGTSLSLPWSMMPQYQMMFLPGQNAAGGEDGTGGGHVVVMPTDGKDGNRGALGGAQQQSFLDAASLQMALQQQLTAAGDAAMVAQMAGAAADQQTQRARIAAVQQQQDAAKATVPKPPKKPLTPYMMFSKTVSIVNYIYVY